MTFIGSLNCLVPAHSKVKLDKILSENEALTLELADVKEKLRQAEQNYNYADREYIDAANAGITAANARMNEVQEKFIANVRRTRATTY